jgi:uncharacterized protein
MNSTIAETPAPWYRQTWPWFLMSGPAIVVVAGFFTLHLALASQDGLVVDDYYKQGKAINQSLKRDDVARAAGLSATVEFDQASDIVRVNVTRSDTGSLPNSLALLLAHATRSGLDRKIALTEIAPNSGRYRGTLQPLVGGKWTVLLEDREKTWRLQREVLISHERIPAITLVALAP